MSCCLKRNPIVSTVSADLAVKALSDPSIVHIYGDTTLEFPSTTEYAERFRKNHPNAIFQIAKNDEQDFYDVCEDIGPPARMMRWCCSMFKTGPITRVINSLYDSQQILTFYGISYLHFLALYRHYCPILLRQAAPLKMMFLAVSLAHLT